MPNEVTLSGAIFLAPYKGRLYHYLNTGRFYLTSNVVDLYRYVFGENCILTGLTVSSFSLNSDYLFTVTFTSGTAVVGGFFLELPSVTLDLDLRPYGDSGMLVCNVGYCNLDLCERNPPYFKLSYYNGDMTAPLPWDPQRDRLVLGVFSYTKVPRAVVNRTPRLHEEGYTLQIGNNAYPVAPRDMLVEALRRFLDPHVLVVPVTAHLYSQGYVDVPAGFSRCEVSVLDGPVLAGKDGLVSPDYELADGRLYFRNGTYGGRVVSGLSDEIAVGDILKIEFLL